MTDRSPRMLALSALLTALATACSPFFIPVGAAKCFPVQHLINVVAGLILGPLPALACAFCTSLLRNLLGTGSLLAFPGSMFGAFLAGLIGKKYGTPGAMVGELIGTGLIGSLTAYPVAVLLMGKQAALFTFTIPFLISSTGGALAGGLLWCAMKHSGMADRLDRMINGTPQRKHSFTETASSREKTSPPISDKCR